MPPDRPLFDCLNQAIADTLPARCRCDPQRSQLDDAVRRAGEATHHSDRPPVRLGEQIARPRNTQASTPALLVVTVTLPILEPRREGIRGIREGFEP